MERTNNVVRPGGQGDHAPTNGVLNLHSLRASSAPQVLIPDQGQELCQSSPPALPERIMADGSDLRQIR